MIRDWFKSREAVDIGAALADQFARAAGPAAKLPDAGERGEKAKAAQDHALQEILRRVDEEISGLRLNFYKRAKFANAFKWKLLENGIDGETADHASRTLLVHLAMSGTALAQEPRESAAATEPTDQPVVGSARQLLAQGNKCVARGAYADAVPIYEDLLRLDPRHATAHNNLGAALCKLCSFKDAETHFRKAISIEPNFPDAQSNLGNLLRWKGENTESENWLRRALKLNPRFVDARVNLGLTLAFMNRSRDAKGQFEKALKLDPRNADALCGLAFVAKTEGRFDEADALFKRALEIHPKLSRAWAAQVGLRRMTVADGAWLDGAEEVATSGIGAYDEAELRFAMGKYCDDVGNFKRAFENYKRANDLLKPIVEPYDRVAHTAFVDDLIRLYPPGAFATGERVAPGAAGTFASAKPVFVVGMPRSGTSLTEQIIASHPSAMGAGELEFWSEAMRAHGGTMRQGSRLDEPTRKKLADSYLRVLESYSPDALRIVDKAPVNADHLGLIHSIFPNARIIYMQRDPIDTCLSCYFQHFSLAMGFATDLSDLAHYYREHRRLVAHWRRVLPPGTILDVPYEKLVADQEGWTRRILKFIDLDWDERCLNFQETSRTVVTVSFWQVRQKIYKNSVQRWRNYEKFIRPLLSLRNLDG
jgi:tetratricopeptide (TPR) repeat protein